MTFLRPASDMTLDKNLLSFISIIVGFFFIILAVNNPTEQDLKNEIRSRFMETMAQNSSDSGEVDALAFGLANLLSPQIIENGIEIKTTNFVVFSVFKVKPNAALSAFSNNESEYCFYGIMKKFMLCEMASPFEDLSFYSSEETTSQDSQGFIERLKSWGGDVLDKSKSDTITSEPVDSVRKEELGEYHDLPNSKKEWAESACFDIRLQGIGGSLVVETESGSVLNSPHLDETGQQIRPALVNREEFSIDAVTPYSGVWLGLDVVGVGNISQRSSDTPYLYLKQNQQVVSNTLIANNVSVNWEYLGHNYEIAPTGDGGTKVSCFGNWGSAGFEEAPN